MVPQRKICYIENQFTYMSLSTISLNADTLYTYYLYKDLKIPWFAIGGVCANNISHLKSYGFKKVALVSQLMNSENPKEEAIMILKELSHEN